MASSPPRSCPKQSGWPSLCPRPPAYARPHARASPPPRPLPLRSAPHSPGLALASALASTTQGATSVTPSEPAHIVLAPPPSGAKHSRKRHALRGPCALIHSLRVGTPWHTVPYPSIALLDAEEDLVINLKEGYDLILANINKNVIFPSSIAIFNPSAPNSEITDWRLICLGPSITQSVNSFFSNRHSLHIKASSSPY